MRNRRSLWIAVLLMVCFICEMNAMALGEGNAAGGRISLSPSYINLGSITQETTSFTFNATNCGEDAQFTAVIDNQDGVPITLEPDSFFLKADEGVKITATISNNDLLKIGAYDISISFIPDGEKEEETSVDAQATNSLRLTFRKEGVIVASNNVKDIRPVQTQAFYSILCNFYSAKKTFDTSLNITRSASGEVVYHQEGQVTMEPYPWMSYYGHVDTPLPTDPWEYGDYVYNLVVQDQGAIVLNYSVPFNVGEMSGEILWVFTRDVQRGEPAVFETAIQNTGTQNLPVSVKIDVMDQSGNFVYEEEQQAALTKGELKEFSFTWPTNVTKAGRYSIDYVIKMADQVHTGTLYYAVYQNYLVLFIVLAVLLLLVLLLLLLLIIRWLRRRSKVDR